LSRLLTVTLLLLMCAGSVAADERPVVSGVSVYVSDGRIVCDVSCGGLFSEQIVGTVKSGLPAVVELLYSIEADEGGTVSSGIYSYELRYDVWDDIFFIQTGDSSRSFDTFDGMKNAIESLQEVTVIPADRVDRKREYAVFVTVAVHPLSGSDRQRIAGYVEETVGARSHDSWREQVLNINDLIGWFFARDKGTSNRSETFETSTFSFGTLPGAGHSPEGRFFNPSTELIVAIEVR
jgi:hypothetical protein